MEVLSAVPVRLREARPWHPRMLFAQVPVAVALLGLGIWGGISPVLLPALAWLAATTPELVRVDLAEHRLPDRLTLPGYPLALAGIGTGALTGTSAVPSLTAGAAFLGLLLLLGVAGGMGLGDVKLGGVLGLVLGGVGGAAAPAGLLVAFFGGGLAAILLLARRGRHARLPFGPFLLGGFWTAVLLLG